MSDPRIKVVYIAGAGRSGTTLLDVLLGELDGFFSAGEMRWLWWGTQEGWQCGCGRPLGDCDVWVRIMKTAFSDHDPPLSIKELLRLQNSAARLHWIPRLLAQSPRRDIRWMDLASYREVLSRLYSAVAEVTRARVIVDSSKNAAEAAILRLLPNIDPYLIHLVRDARGVANSMKRTVKMEPLASRTFEQPRHSTAISSLIWMRKNIAADLTKTRYGRNRSTLLRYEDLLADPERVLRELADFLGESFSGIELSDERTVHLHDNHTSWGNPSRFRRGTVTLHEDGEWRSRLGIRDKASSISLAGPLLLRYGYLFR